MDVSAIGAVMEAEGTGLMSKKTALGKEDFLNLLLKQLSYQDPLNPMDSTEFTAQLTQFTTVEELNNINSTLEKVLTLQKSAQNASLAGLLGKDVQVSGDTVSLGETAEISYELPDNAASVKIEVLDETGRLVLSVDDGRQVSGPNHYIWNGTDMSGRRLPEGTYRYSVEAMDGEGRPMQVLTRTSGTVTGLSFSDGITLLQLNDGRTVYLSDIQGIQERRL